MRRRRRPASFVIEAARGNLFGEKTKAYNRKFSTKAKREARAWGRALGNVLTGSKPRRRRR
jgi:hypothetical protein